MTPAKAQNNIIGVLDFQFKSSKDENLKKEIKQLKQKIVSFFENSELKISKLKEEVKSLIFQSSLYRDAKRKIVKLLEKLK
jgi:hypothetical protein